MATPPPPSPRTRSLYRAGSSFKANKPVLLQLPVSHSCRSRMTSRAISFAPGDW